MYMPVHAAVHIVAENLGHDKHTLVHIVARACSLAGFTTHTHTHIHKHIQTIALLPRVASGFVGIQPIERGVGSPGMFVGQISLQDKLFHPLR